MSLVDQEVALLAKLPLFAKLPCCSLKLLAFTSEALHFEAGSILFHRGDNDDSVYLITEGEVAILGCNDSDDLHIVRGRNALIGEMAALTSKPRSATVRAETDLHCLKISGELFLKLITENPASALDVMRQLSCKLAEAQGKLEQMQCRITTGHD